MVVPALPALEREFDTTTAWATWLLTGFLLSASVATPLLGRLGDQYGKERLLLVSLLIFFAGSVAAVFAPNIAVLIACRGVRIRGRVLDQRRGRGRGRGGGAADHPAAGHGRGG
jgi:MFS family permease